MVTQTETTQIITQPKWDDTAQPSIKRWLKHFCHISAAHRYFNKRHRLEIAQVVQQAEKGHVGEIQVVIEGHIPLSQAYRQNTRLRAQQLFAELGVWDTELNSGVLLYLNLCERKVEIVVDRGLKHATTTDIWEQICQHMVALLMQKHYVPAVMRGVVEIGQVLDAYYVHADTHERNELPNEPIVLD